jgi:methionine synthase II (cobalamin-independent)
VACGWRQEPNPPPAPNPAPAPPKVVTKEATIYVPFDKLEEVRIERVGAGANGVIDLADLTVETPGIVAARIRRALPFVAPERIIVAPDCGMKYLPRDVAFAKMCAMVEGARIVRGEIEGAGRP